MKTMLATLNDAETAGELQSLFDEYEQGDSKEAKYVKQLDKLEMITQALAYESNPDVDPKSVDTFFNSAPVSYFTDQTIRAVASGVHQARRG